MIKLILTGIFTEFQEKRIEKKMLLDANSFGIRYYDSPIELVDTNSDQEEYHRILSESKIIVILYDLQSGASFEKAKEILLNLPKSEQLYKAIVVGNKFDLLDANSKKFIVEQHKTELSQVSVTF